VVKHSGVSENLVNQKLLMPNPFSKLINPWYPGTALGIEKGVVAMVHLEKARGDVFTVRGAATVELPDELVRPSFEDVNISDPTSLAVTLGDLAGSAGLLKQKRWSISLPEASTRTMIVIMENQVASNAELEEMLSWKMERGLNAPLDELAISREKLPKDAQGRDRYLVIAVRHSVREEYERIFDSLGWRAGMILPRHLGESQWLTQNGSSGDGLLLSFSEAGFTAAVYRDNQPIILRNVACDPEECEDELYRLLLFYRDRRTTQSQEGPSVLSRLLVVGDRFAKQRVSDIVNETLDSNLHVLGAHDVGLQLPHGQLDFDSIAAPAGLATLSAR
jgi:hypothetical protein